MIKARPFLFLAACGTAAVAFTLLFGTTSYAQQDDRQQDISGAIRIFNDAKKKLNDAKNRSDYLKDQFDEMAYQTNRYVKKLSDVRISQKLSKLRTELKNAKSTEQKAQAKKSVRQALVEYFDGDMKQRQAELNRLMSRSDKMSEALKKRAAAKERLVDLQLKSFKYEIEGLGLFSKRSKSSGRASEFDPFGGDGFEPSNAFTPRNRVPNDTFSNFGVANASTSETGLGSRKKSKKTNSLKIAMDSVNKARQKVQSAKSEEDRTKAATELRNTLNEYFDKDLKAREQELDTINEGLKKMQAGLKKRADAKDDIVDLQLQIIVNEAEGLGFFRKSASSSSHDDSLLMQSGFRSPGRVRRTETRRVAR